ncbi:glycine dehydrogenase subunit 2 [Hathewaya proteolytica DSM 3090]|uniref:Probable glycine dehydrogenase (decarboxylating) subunit 2 n=1 Tax=Hathewaya proteolytica DSM 3090 TaxID=1121331 RepID=A0A1M6SPH5_9CLOT|nr:aminomethyl-transferring glycine dehydrogenase subunit GcvPB [Hathewaya proteolytica]SHK46585.1 glycine dehydrogenase subunit 2 [Hathewaya proteolytica DSM 3090]
MQLVFEKSVRGRKSSIFPKCDVEEYNLPNHMNRANKPNLPEMSETDVSRHFTELADQTYGVNNGFYPLGSCTMKYNPRINEEVASLPGFAKIHPLQPKDSVQGCIEAMVLAEKYLAEITGMDAITFQPAAGAHGEFTGVMLIKEYHLRRGDTKRNKIIIPDSAHGTNPATAVMAGFKVVNIPSNEKGGMDVEKLRAAVGEDTAGLMLTNPNTLGIFDENILEITKIVHEAGGLNYYDGANLNPIMGVARPGDMGFDVVHLNLHKTFSTPHGGGGPGSGTVGCKNILKPYLPKPYAIKNGEEFELSYDIPESIGQVKAFYGNFLVVMRALTYVMTLGKDGIVESANNAVLNANYMRCMLKDTYDMAMDGICMHEFIITLEKMHTENGVSAMDIAKAMVDRGIHPPTMYFPLIVHEALMFEPTETESKTTIDNVVSVLKEIHKEALENPSEMHNLPLHAYIRRPDEVKAAREPKLKFQF